MPLEPGVSMFLIAGCRQPAMGYGQLPDLLVPFLHSSRRGIGARRTCARDRHAPASAADSRMPQGE
jgi:hypothetical protein